MTSVVDIRSSNGVGFVVDDLKHFLVKVNILKAYNIGYISWIIRNHKIL